MRRIPLLMLILCAACVPAFSQGEIPVDLYTGTPSISIPLGNVSSIDVSQPISLTYSANAAGRQSWYGSGWSLQAAGSIVREVRGLPDDCGYSETPKKGWLYLVSGTDSVYKKVSDFLAASTSDTLSNTYGTRSPNTGEILDYETLTSWSDQFDTEPDIFSYSANGLSGKFIIAKTNKVRLIPYRDISITYTRDATTKKITSFTLKTNDGYTYVFNTICTASKQLVVDEWNGAPIMSTEYAQYANQVSYNAEWMLTQVTSPNNNTIVYNYTAGEFQSSIPDEPISVAMFHENDAFVAGSYDYMTRSLFKLKTSRQIKIPSSVTGSTGSKVEFTYNTTDKRLEKITFRDSRKGAAAPADFVRSFDLSYISVAFGKSVDGGGGINILYSQWFLRRLRETSNCDRQDPYVFSYNAQQSTEVEADYTQWSVITDYIGRGEWNFYQLNHNDVNYPLLHVYPKEGMAERYRLNYIPNPSSPPDNYFQLQGTGKNPGSAKGTLSSITYPTGGRTLFYFEPNDYHDAKANKRQYASGMRVKSILYFDGTGANPIKKTFDYTDGTGKSSGKIFRQPIYHIPAFQWKDPYYANLSGSQYYKLHGNMSTQERWERLTIRTEWEITPNDADNAVGYTRVKVSRTGSGYAVHEFNVPATYGQKTNGRWATPITVFARQSTNSSSTTPTTNMDNTIFQYGGEWRYPNAPNPFYDYARGLPVRVSTYSETGKLVKKVETLYQNLCKTDTSAVAVNALKYDRFPLSEDGSSTNRIYLFSKYFLLTDADKVPKTETVTLYDPNETGSTKYVTETTEYAYTSANHKSITEVKRTATDGTIYRTKFKYPRDYTSQTTGEPAIPAIKDLITNFQHGSPIETFSTMKKGSDPEVVTGGSIIKYSSSLGVSRPMPESSWALELDAPVALGSFTTSYVGTYQFYMDSRYKKVSGVENYAGTGLPLRTMSPVSRDTTEIGYGLNTSMPIVKAVNAGSNQVVFSDFDNPTNFTPGYSSVYLSDGRSGAYGFYPSVTIYKNDLKRIDVKNYVISFWLKSNANVTFQVDIKNAVSPYSTTYATKTFVANNTSSEFKYVRKVISFDSIASNVKTFRLELKATGLTNPGSTGYTAGLMPVIDDLFFFPEGVHMESYTYQIPYGVASVTTGTGDASHISYDGLGRQTLLRDRNLNIVKKNTYQSTNNDPLFAEFTASSAIYVNASTTFTASPPQCAGTVTYRWDWGDGAGFTTGTATQAHTFTTTGTKTVTLEVTASGFSTKTQTLTILVQPEPITANMCAKGVSEFNATTAVYTNNYTCSQISTTPSTGRTTFKVYNVTGCEGGCTYKWIRREMGALTWLTMPPTGTEYTCEKIVTNTNSFEVACEIKRGSEPPVMIGPMSVNIYNP